MYYVRRLKIDQTDLLDALSLASGSLYSQTVVSFWRTVRKQNLWLKPSSLMRWHSGEMLHAHSADAVVQQFSSALKSWRKRRKSDPNARPPRKRRRFNKIIWKSSAIRVKDGNLVLSNARGTPSLPAGTFVVPAEPSTTLTRTTELPHKDTPQK